MGNDPDDPEEPHLQVHQFAQKTQSLALTLLEPDVARRLPRVCDFMRDVPLCNDDADRVVVALIIRRLADAFFGADRPRDLLVGARLQRTHVRDVHIGRALECISRKFANPALDLRTVAGACHLSAPYLSHLISVNTRHGFHTHVSTARLLYATRLLATTALSVEEVAVKTGFSSTAVVDREFRKRFNMTPSEFRRWAT